MFCQHCGTQVTEGAAFCMKCGQEVGTAPTQAKNNSRTTLVLILVVAGVLAIVGIPVIGMIAAVAIPTFLNARDKANFAVCVSALAKVKAAEEMYIVETGKTTDNPDLLGRFFDPSCTAPDGSDCKGKVTASLEKSCKPGSVEIEVAGDKSDYAIKAKSNTKKECAVCITREFLFPSSYIGCRPEFKCGE